MTQPVQEPTEGRQMAGQQWATRQLVRRPAQPTDAYHNSTPVYALHGGDMAHYISQAEASGFSFTEDLTLRYGGYLGSTAQNAYFVIGMPLGPAGSRWAVDLYYNTGSDYGTFDIEWATTSIDAVGSYGPGGSTITLPEFIEDPSGISTWYNSGRSATGNWQFDAYAAAPGVQRQSQMDNFIIVGADGAMLSANGTTADPPAAYEMDAGGDGSVWWWLRLKVKSKNASSSGYRCRIQAIRVARLAEGGWYSL